MDDERDDEHQEDDAGGFGASTKGLTDLFRRALATGIGSVFMTEESIRKTLSEMKMPKEAVSYVVAQADKTKNDLVGALARELRSFLDNLELQELISKGFDGKTFEIHTTIRVVSDENGDRKFEQVKKEMALVKTEGDAEPKKKPRRRRKRKSDSTSDDDE